MQQMIKKFIWITLLTVGSQAAWGFSLLGPVANGTEDAYQTSEIGYNPLANSGAPPYFIDGLLTGPKNLSEGYRHNTPVMYYTFDETFSGYFGASGEVAVQQAFDILNNTFTNNPTGITNGLDGYSSSLSEFPLNSQGVNYQAQALGLLDLKSVTLSLLLEQLGLADAVRYTWALHDRYQEPNTTCPAGLEYLVILRNFDVTASPLDELQYSPYVNGELYSYYIPVDLCGTTPAPPDVDALEIPADPLANNPPVASGDGEDALLVGDFYTGLTRDDVAGLRYLMSSSNVFNPSLNYSEAPAAGSALFSTNLTAPVPLITSNLNVLASEAITNNPTTMQALFPGLELVSTNYYLSNFISVGINAYLTNYIGSPYPSLPVLVTKKILTTNLVSFYQYTYANVVTNSYYTNVVVTNQVIQTVPQADGSYILQTNSTAIHTNLVTGDYFIIPAGSCPPGIISTQQVNVSMVTNSLISTNIVTNGVSYLYSQTLFIPFTNHVFSVAPCTQVTNAVGDYQGIKKIQFVHVADDNYDPLLAQFIQPITNTYTMVVTTNHQPATETFQRIVTTPDFVFRAADLASGPAAIPTVVTFNRSIPLFNNSRTPAGNAGPGTIDPGSTITFNKVGPVFENSSPSFLSQSSASLVGFIWASFDGTTNAPIVYPNGTSIATLASEALIQISPTTLPNGTRNISYPATMLSATGGVSPYTWSLASNSPGMPPGLTLSSNGMISGTPTKSGVYYIIVQLADSSFPASLVNINYSITIN